MQSSRTHAVEKTVARLNNQILELQRKLEQVEAQIRAQRAYEPDYQHITRQEAEEASHQAATTTSTSMAVVEPIAPVSDTAPVCIDCGEQHSRQRYCVAQEYVRLRQNGLSNDQAAENVLSDPRIDNCEAVVVFARYGIFRSD